MTSGSNLLHREANAEATAAGDWYEAQRPGLGADFAGELERAFQMILEDPQTWPTWPGVPAGLAVRRLLLAGFPDLRSRWRTSPGPTHRPHYFALRGCPTALGERHERAVQRS